MRSTLNAPTPPDICATLYLSGGRQALEEFASDYGHYLSEHGHLVPDALAQATALRGLQWRQCTMAAQYQDSKTGRLVAQFYGHGFLREIPVAELQGEAVPVALAPREQPANPALAPRP